MRIAIGLVLLVLGAVGMLWVQVILRSRRTRRELRAISVDPGDLAPPADGLLQGALKLMCVGAAGVYVLIYEGIGLVESSATVVAYIGCCLCIHAFDVNGATSDANKSRRASITNHRTAPLLLSGLLLIALGAYFAGGRNLLS